jgi:hypothetical protein
MAKGIGLPQTKGEFKVRGLSTGLKRDNALKDITTKTKKQMYILNFGVETAPESTVFLTLQGMEKDEVYFGKRSEVKGQKGEVKKVPWAKRNEEQPEGFRLMGVGLGLEKGEDGKNIVQVLTEFDAAKEVYTSLEDETPVFVRGELEYSSFKNNNDEVRRSKKFAIKNLYLANDVDFEAEDFQEMSDFKQKIIFMGISKVDDKEDPRFEVEAKIVTYNSVEDTDFIIRDASLANQFKKALKPYTAIEIWGNIFNKIDTEDVEEENKDVWGQEDNFKRVNKNYIRELVITGADPESIDTETYTEEAINEALKALNEFGQASNSSGDWGNKEEKKADISDDDLPW